MVNKNILSVITARANSKGLPGKNFRSIYGKPLIEWSVLASLQSQYVAVTSVSSNDPEIERICEQWGSRDDFVFVRRPDDMASPISSNEEAMIHAYNEIGEDFDALVLLQPTSPARKDRLIDRCIEKIYLYDGDNDSCFTASKHTPFFYRMDVQKQRVIPTNHKCVNRPMRQDLIFSDFYWHDNGNVYVTKRDTFFRKNNRMGDRPTIVETDFFESLQIDDEQDFLIMDRLADLYDGFL